MHLAQQHLHLSHYSQIERFMLSARPLGWDWGSIFGSLLLFLLEIYIIWSKIVRKKRDRYIIKNNKKLR
jgi:hypothetical protein